MLLIDTHTHIYDPAFDIDRAETVQRALDAGVGMMLLPNVDASTIKPMLETHEQFPDCTRMMMGLQPEEVKGDYKQVLALMEKELERGIYIGVGEIGLDFYWDTAFEHEQLDVFETQLGWAKQLQLPLSIHCRNAFNFIFHLGLGGVTTYKNCALKDYLHNIPLDRIVLETDAPYLSPVPHRGKRNEPAFMVDTAKRIAELYDTPLEDLTKTITRNTINVFNRITEQLNN